MSGGIKRVLLVFDQNCFSSDTVWENLCQLISQKNDQNLVYLFTNFSKKVDLSHRLEKKLEDSKKLIKKDSTHESINQLFSFLATNPEKKDQILCSMISLIFLEQQKIIPKLYDQKSKLNQSLDTKTSFLLLGDENPFGLSPKAISKLNINEVNFFGKEPGIYTSAPKITPASLLIKKLNYEEAKEISSLTSTQFTPSSLNTFQKLDLPLNFGCLNPLREAGTTIQKEDAQSGPAVKVVGVKNNVTVVSITNGDMWRTSGFLIDIFKCFHSEKLSLDLISTSETNITLSLDPTPERSIAEIKDLLTQRLSGYGSVRIHEGLSTISLIGHNIRSTLPQISPIFKVFEDQKIYLMSQAANDINLSFIIDSSHSIKCQKDLHEILFSKNKKTQLFGPSWQEIHEGTKKQTSTQKKPWWPAHQKYLFDLSKKETPLYVYSEKSIIQNARDLLSLEVFNKVFYAMKANNHPDILKSLDQTGIHFETVSIGEIRHLKKVLPKVKAKDILFTPNFIGKNEFMEALKEGVTVTLDNIFPLKSWPEIFKNQNIILRIDPGQGKGHHDFVRTAGEQSKFGIIPQEIPEIVELAKNNQIKIIGLHAHAGSGIQQAHHWKDIGFFLCKLAKDIPDVEIINLGGGLGVANRPGDSQLDLKKLREHIKELKKSFPQYKLWLEPGRYLVSNAGVLLTKVTQLKRKGHTHYIGIDAGMNTLLRPSLYGSYHHILNLTKLDQASTEVINIVGPICETGDRMGIARVFPKSEENDIILIENAGAYGKVMSSTYNLRKEPQEVYIKENKF
ncbi:diaminopimelate decarboxylase [Bacteriovoracales bacterium]|nr:diaminopimelate decarboxylase [Bacteriovoracales bacterium]